MNALMTVQSLPDKPLKFTRPKTSQAIRDAREIQRLMLDDMRKKKTEPAVRASLARSWVLVQSLIQELRGIPKPGQLRPDLDPVQLTKALKRAKHRSPIFELANAHHETPLETAEPLATDAATKKVKESLSQTGTVPAPPPPGEP